LQRRHCGEEKLDTAQYSRIENGKVEPSVSTLEKLAKVFGVSVSEFFRSNNLEDELNLPILEKIKMIDTLVKDEQQAIFKVIDLAISNKKLKYNLQSLLQ
jgi:transcriptional regulator with XRE-family HTH domain